LGGYFFIYPTLCNWFLIILDLFLGAFIIGKFSLFKKGREVLGKERLEETFPRGLFLGEAPLPGRGFWEVWRIFKFGGLLREDPFSLPLSFWGLKKRGLYLITTSLGELWGFGEGWGLFPFFWPFVGAPEGSLFFFAPAFGRGFLGEFSLLG